MLRVENVDAWNHLESVAMWSRILDVLSTVVIAMDERRLLSLNISVNTGTFAEEVTIKFNTSRLP